MHLKNPFTLCRLLAFIVVAAAFHLPLRAQTQPSYWQQQVDFTIEVTLNDTEHTLDGFETVRYTNNSPDTLYYIWFHLWPNAYKNDKTAFSEQLLVNDRTDFYFSGKEQRGYINRLAFKADAVTAKTEDHPLYIDVVKLLLPTPLPPKGHTIISTPFHVQLPYNFSRGGHVKQSYQVAQWYPKPAVYDHDGWHPMPYLHQGEFYSEFGNYDVRINVPASYIVAATGELQNQEELAWLKKKAGEALPEPVNPVKPAKGRAVARKTAPVKAARPVARPLVVPEEIKSLRYLQNRVHDFAWFADKRLAVRHDTLALASGRVVDVWSYFLPEGAQYWKNSIRYIKDAVATRSAWLGEYPFSTVSAVEAKMGFDGGMEYPTITSISPVHNSWELEQTIVHEVGHNWLYGILASNERAHPWMDEGMNTYYDWRYSAWKKGIPQAGKQPGGQQSSPARMDPEALEALLFEGLASVHKDQPINTPAPAFTPASYALVGYVKAASWMKQLEAQIGTTLFDSCMHEYYRRWQFRHPAPDDFRLVAEAVSNRSLDDLFARLNSGGSLQPPVKKPLRVTPFASLQGAGKRNYIGIAPAVGANTYDGFMIGGLVHNYQLPLPRLQFLAAPLYATRSKQLGGLARVSYSWYPGTSIFRVDAGVGAASFSMNEFLAGQQRLFTRFLKIAPVVRVTLKEPNALSRMERFIQFKTFFIREGAFDFRQVINGPDTLETVGVATQGRVLNQLKVVIRNARILYPYSGEFQVEQQRDFIRAAFTGRHFFNYANNKGGMQARVFAGKFFYSGAGTVSKQLNTDRYQLNLSGANGAEDYTYSNYFVGRNDFEGWTSQQLMIRDGGFRVRTELLSNKVGKTDNWLVAGNLSSNVPDNINPLRILPFAVPLKVFADVGTYAEAWDKNAETSKILFDAGLQLSLFRETLNLYFPLVYSSVFKSYYRSTFGNNRFWKTVSFSIDIQDFNLKKIDRRIPL